MRPILFLCAAAILLAGRALAELPPSVYEQRQKAAPEHLILEVQRVDIEPGEENNQQRVHAVALVRKVIRTGTGLEPGALITISYVVTRRLRDYVGPGEVPILQEHAETVAFLSKSPESDAYHPAAGVMSFSEF